MMAGEKITVHMSGGGPWGFRLYGGENDPLVIAKLRNNSKAAEAGILEGDVLLTINNNSCQGLNHPTAMALVEQSGNEITFQLLRGSAEKSDVDAAFCSLSNLAQPKPQSMQVQEQPEPVVLNGYFEGETPGVKSITQMFQQGDTTKQVTTQTSQQKVGGTTVTKVRREEITHTGTGPSLSPYPKQEQGTALKRPAMFNVSNNATSASIPTETWKPSGQMNKPLAVVGASGGIKVEHNPDHSVTMSFGLGDSKENVVPTSAPHPVMSKCPAPNPVPAFSVKKVVSTSRVDRWTPGSIPKRGPAPPLRQFTPEPEVQEQEQHFSFEEPHDQLDMIMDTYSSPFVTIDDGMKHIHLAKILHEGPASDDSGNESPGTFWMKKKKIFADSSFYDDPQHRYPTIEEQIKMARKVANSLVAPANRNARGHRMFVKRKQKSAKWTTGMEPMEFELVSDEEDEKYFNPNPWTRRSGGTHTWQPPSQQIQHIPQKAPPPQEVPQHQQPIQQPYMSYKPIAHKQPSLPSAPKVPIPAPPPPPPPMDLPMPSWRSSSAFSPDTPDSEGYKTLGVNELEKIRLHGQKSKHTNVPPQMAFSLAADMKKMKGKGGRLFAKRRERAEKWVVGETFGQSDADPSIMQKLVLSAQLENPESSAHSMPSHGYTQPLTYKGGMPVNRLSQMIDPPKAAMSPWDACADFGNLDKAFDHLEGYMAMKKGNYKSAVAQNLDKAVKRSYMTPFRPGMIGSPVATSTTSYKTPTYSQMKPWQSTGDIHRAPPTMKPSSFHPPQKSSVGFRPVNFMAPPQMPPQPTSHHVEDTKSAKSITEEDGYCDL